LRVTLKLFRVPWPLQLLQHIAHLRCWFCRQKTQQKVFGADDRVGNVESDSLYYGVVRVAEVIEIGKAEPDVEIFNLKQGAREKLRQEYSLDGKRFDYCLLEDHGLKGWVGFQLFCLLVCIGLGVIFLIDAIADDEEVQASVLKAGGFFYFLTILCACIAVGKFDTECYKEIAAHYEEYDTTTEGRVVTTYYYGHGLGFKLEALAIALTLFVPMMWGASLLICVGDDACIAEDQECTCFGKSEESDDTDA